MAEQIREIDWAEDTWAVADAYFSDPNRLIDHHLTSFNYFVESQIPMIIDGCNPIKFETNYNQESGIYQTEYHIILKNPQIAKPMIKEYNGTSKQMYPNDARLRNLTYAGNLYVDIEQRLITVDVKSNNRTIKQLPSFESVNIGMLPIMLGSKFCVLSEQTLKTREEMGECKYDRGGYFIIKGTERAIMPQERIRENRVMVYEDEGGKYSHIAQINSIEYGVSSYPKRTEVKLKSSGGTIHVKINSVNQDVPLFVIFRALGVISDRDIVSYIVGDLEGDLASKMLEYLRPSVIEARHFSSQQMAIDFIARISTLNASAKKVTNPVLKLAIIRENFLANLFPHVGESEKKKAFFLGYMTARLLRFAMGIIKADDRDSFFNKRISNTGDLMATLFRNSINKLIRRLSTDIKGSKDSYEEIALALRKKIKPSEFFSTMSYSMSTGNWGNRNQATKSGVSQTLKRLSYMDMLSTLRRVISPVEKSGKLPEPRKLHNTQIYYFCPAETPEGGAVGLVKNLAITAGITIPSNPAPVAEALEDLGMLPIDYVQPTEVARNARVFLNGDWLGIHPDPIELVRGLKRMRAEGRINIYTGIAFVVEEGNVEVNTDGGRMYRPLYKVVENRPILTSETIERLRTGELGWNDLLMRREGEHPVIEYVDVDESDTLMYAGSAKYLAQNKRENETFLTYTHMEIDPSLMFGLVVSTVPLPDHSQAPRNLYAGSMGKQGMGMYCTSYKRRMDTQAYVQHYTQAPIALTRASKYLKVNETPSGCNVIVAILAYTGYNMEDSLIFNQSSLDRGLFTADYYRTYKDEIKKTQSAANEEIFMRPEKYRPDGSQLTIGMKKGSYDKLDADGFIKIGEKVEPGDIIIGKVVPLKMNKKDDPKYKDSSSLYKGHDGGTIDWVYHNKRNVDNLKFAKVRVRTLRIPEVGDKFASTAGQKGTIGITYRQADMPYTASGLVPDIIMSPWALPKRMTVNQLISMLLGKVAVSSGMHADVSPYNEADMNEVADILQRDYGFSRSGEEILYCGKTGRQMRSTVFIGPTFYQRLKHMVSDKMHSRASGPKQVLTQQPTEGKSRDGGLRLGEMERDSLLSHGIPAFLKERMFDSSDKYVFFVCDTCHLIAVANPYQHIYQCRYCKGEATGFTKVQAPYAAKLFMQEQMAIGIAPRLFTE